MDDRDIINIIVKVIALVKDLYIKRYRESSRYKLEQIRDFYYDVKNSYHTNEDSN